MGGKYRLWLILLAAAIVAIQEGSKAFFGPWIWNFDQIAFTGVCAVILLAVASWMFRWMRYGTEGVKQRWNKLSEGVTAELSNGRKMRHGVILWIVVAVALMIFFNVIQHY